MSLWKSIVRLGANTVMLPVSAIQDIASIGDETKNHSELIERAKRWSNSATEIGESVYDVSKVVGKEVGSGFASVGRTIQDVADGKEKPKENITVRVSEEAVKETSKEN